MQPPSTGRRPELPTLAPGVTLLQNDTGATEALHALVLDQLIAHGDATAYWIDGRGSARTTRFARLAPRPRLLERVQVARGFTAYQHHRLTERLVERVAAGSAAPSLIVIPDIDWQYRGDEPQGLDPQPMLTRSLARLDALASARELPVLVTRTMADAFSAPVATAAERTIICEQTQFGPRFIADDGFDTLVYPTADGSVQTTFAFWQEVLAARTDTSPVDTMSPATDAVDATPEPTPQPKLLSPAGPTRPRRGD